MKDRIVERRRNGRSKEHRKRRDTSLLTDLGILRHMEAGNIIIDPFNPENLHTVSYDFTLGRNYFREQAPPPGVTIYSAFDEEDVRSVWGEPQQAVRAELLMKQGIPLRRGIFPDDEVILIGPHETILAHTEEFIGGRNCVTAVMHARSSAGRNFLEVCKCAGWGDVGYINRWTLEITNNSKHRWQFLVVGRRYGQLAFHEVGETRLADYATEEFSGKYQTSSDIEVLKKKWKPEDMLPKMWKDPEVARRLNQSSGGVLVNSQLLPSEISIRGPKRVDTSEPDRNYLRAVVSAMSGDYSDETWLVIRDGELVAINEDPMSVVVRLGLDPETRSQYKYVQVGTVKRYHLQKQQ